MKKTVILFLTITISILASAQNTYEYLHHFDPDKGLIHLCNSGDHNIGVFGGMFDTRMMDITTHHEGTFGTFGSVIKYNSYSLTDCDYCIYDMFDYDIDFPAFYFAKSDQGMYSNYFLEYFSSGAEYEIFNATNAIAINASRYLAVYKGQKVSLLDSLGIILKEFTFSDDFSILRGQDDRIRLLSKDSLFIWNDVELKFENVHAYFVNQPQNNSFKWHGQLQKYVSHSPSFTEFLSISNDTVFVEHLDHSSEHFASAISGDYLYFIPKSNKDIVLSQKLNSVSLDTVYANTDERIMYNRLFANKEGVYVSGNVSFQIGVSQPIIQNLIQGQDYYPQRLDLAFKFISTETALLNTYSNPSFPTSYKVEVSGEFEVENNSGVAIDQFNILSSDYALIAPYPILSNKIFNHHIAPSEKARLPFKDTLIIYTHILNLEYELMGADYKYDSDQSDNIDVLQISVATKDIDYELDFRLFPNPSTDHLYFDQSTYAVHNASIYNSLGQLVMVVPVVQLQNGQIDITELKSGCYFLKLDFISASEVKGFIKN